MSYLIARGRRQGSLFKQLWRRLYQRGSREKELDSGSQVLFISTRTDGPETNTARSVLDLCRRNHPGIVIVHRDVSSLPNIPSAPPGAGKFSGPPMPDELQYFGNEAMGSVACVVSVARLADENFRRYMDVLLTPNLTHFVLPGGIKRSKMPYGRKVVIIAEEASQEERDQTKSEFSYMGFDQCWQMDSKTSEKEIKKTCDRLFQPIEQIMKGEGNLSMGAYGTKDTESDHWWTLDEILERQR